MTIRGWSALRVVSALCLLAAAAACTSSSQTASPQPSKTASPLGIVLPSPTLSPPATVDLESTCSFKLAKGDLPIWARHGFQGPRYDIWPFVTSKRGDMVAVLFGYPLTSPRDENHGENKILWVSKTGISMTVDAELVGTSHIVHLGDVPVGPSNVDMPTPGCWDMTLHLIGDDGPWTDTVDVVYEG